MIIWNQQIINKQKGCQPDLSVIDIENKEGILIGGSPAKMIKESVSWER